MKTSSAKAKGRRLQHWVCGKLSEIFNIQWGMDCEIASREMGQSGTDIRLVGRAKRLIPYSFECKNQENWSMHQWIKQAKENQLPKTDWVLICSKNRYDYIAVTDASTFFNLIKTVYDLKKENKSLLGQIRSK